MIVFVIVNTLAVDKQAELLRQFRMSDVSILLTPKQWFEGEKRYSDISKLPFSSFSVEAEKSGINFRNFMVNRTSF